MASTHAFLDYDRNLILSFILKQIEEYYENQGKILASAKVLTTALMT